MGEWVKSPRTLLRFSPPRQVGPAGSSRKDYGKRQAREPSGRWWMVRLQWWESDRGLGMRDERTRETGLTLLCIQVD